MLRSASECRKSTLSESFSSGIVQVLWERMSTLLPLSVPPFRTESFASGVDQTLNYGTLSTSWRRSSWERVKRWGFTQQRHGTNPEDVIKKLTLTVKTFSFILKYALTDEIMKHWWLTFPCRNTIRDVSVSTLCCVSAGFLRRFDYSWEIVLNFLSCHTWEIGDNYKEYWKWFMIRNRNVSNRKKISIRT